MSRIKVIISGKSFYDYIKLAEYMHFIINDFLNKSNLNNQKQLIKSLNDFSDNILFGKNNGIHKYLLDVKFLPVCVDLLYFCTKSSNSKLLTASLSCVIIITDCSNEMCYEFTKTGLVKFLINETIDICKSNCGPKDQKSLYDDLISIVHNIARYPDCQQCFHDCASIDVFKESITKFIDCKDHRTRILTMATLTWLIDNDEDKTYLNRYSNIINNFVEYIKKAMNYKNRRFEGLSVSELLEVILSLSNIESIRESMLQMKNFMTLISNLIALDNIHSDEKQLALYIVHNLSFKKIAESEEDPDTDKTKDAIERILQLTKKESDRKTIEIVEDIKSELSENPELSVLEIIFDIFVSYCLKDERQVRQIADILTKENFNVCLKKVVKEFSIKEAKESIAQSKMMVFGVSNSYYKDINCHSECQCAYELKKPIIPLILEPNYDPKDWLKNIISRDTCAQIDFSDNSKFFDLTKKLLTHIKKKIGGAGTKKASKPMLKSQSIDRSFIEDKAVTEWSYEEVGEWLLSEGLSNIQKNFVEWNGNTIEYMRKMRFHSFELYSKRLKEEVKLSIIDESKFDSAIERLKDKGSH